MKCFLAKFMFPNIPSIYLESYHDPHIPFGYNKLHFHVFAVKEEFLRKFIFFLLSQCFSSSFSLKSQKKFYELARRRLLFELRSAEIIPRNKNSTLIFVVWSCIACVCMLTTSIIASKQTHPNAITAHAVCSSGEWSNFLSLSRNASQHKNHLRNIENLLSRFAVMFVEWNWDMEEEYFAGEWNWKQAMKRFVALLF